MTMDWKGLLTTFGVVFLAELGDKTQLATLGLAASGRSRLAVFVGSAAALVLASAIAAAGGAALGHVIPGVWLRRGAGALMVVLGVLLVVQR
jgi:putative Ca2+/H+ antiporter (TMEM165/GDT1 family)